MSKGPLEGRTATGKRAARTGAATSLQLPGNLIHSISARELKPYVVAVRHVMLTLVSGRRTHPDRETEDMLRECASFLKHLPTPARQGSVRGLPPKERAQAILKHIHRQHDRYTSYPAWFGAVVRILCQCIAVELFPRSTQAPQYLRTQTSHAVRHLLKSDISILYGQRVKHRISLQGKHLANHLYYLTEPFWRVWLSAERRKQILEQRWLKPPA